MEGGDGALTVKRALDCGETARQLKGVESDTHGSETMNISLATWNHRLHIKFTSLQD